MDKLQVEVDKVAAEEPDPPVEPEEPADTLDEAFLAAAPGLSLDDQEDFLTLEAGNPFAEGDPRRAVYDEVAAHAEKERADYEKVSEEYERKVEEFDAAHDAWQDRMGQAEDRRDRRAEKAEDAATRAAEQLSETLDAIRDAYDYAAIDLETPMADVAEQVAAELEDEREEIDGDEEDLWADVEADEEEVAKDIEAGKGAELSAESVAETLARTEAMAAYSAAQERLLADPMMGQLFPYRAYHATHDDRVRPEHLEMEKRGIGGSNIYRGDDPTWQALRPPWSFNCRCTWSPISLAEAARRGIAEAKTWLETGIEPAERAWVEMPPWRPDAGLPTGEGVSLSAASYELAAGGYTGRKKDSIGRTRCYADGRQVSCASDRHSEGGHDKAKAAAVSRVGSIVRDPASAGPKDLARLASDLSKLTAAEIQQVKKAFGLRASGVKADLIEKVKAEAAKVVKERQQWTRRARAAGVEPKALFQTARQMHDLAGEYQEQVRRMLEDARKSYRSLTGKQLTRSHKAFRGGDYTDLEQFETVARSLSDRYPELLGAHGYQSGDNDSTAAAEALYDRLYAGTPAKPKRSQSYAEALEYLSRNAGLFKDADTGGGEVPF
jgi:SPP1 gp7 family putative phage head morphogenesis protein